MKGILALVFLTVQLELHAQPGDITNPLHVVMKLDPLVYRDSTAHHTVTLRSGGPQPLMVPTEESDGKHVIFQLPTTHGVAGVWEIAAPMTGLRMGLHINARPSFSVTELRIPFVGGEYTIDVDHLHKCIVDQTPEYPPRTERGPDTLACSGGQIIRTFSHGSAIVELFDMLPFTKRAEQAPPAASSEASYPGGMENFQRFIAAHFNKAVIERVGVRTTLSTNVIIERDGSIHNVGANGGNYPELDKEFKRVLQLSSWWQPAVVENIRNTNDPRTFRTIEQSVVINYSVEPDSIWSEIPDEMLSISPSSPTSKDELVFTIHWIGGSCGEYSAKTELLPRQDHQDFTELILYFGATLPAQCEDRQPQSFSYTISPLPAGRYRLKRMPHPSLPEAGWAPDPYAVRFFEVK